MTRAVLVYTSALNIFHRKKTQKLKNSTKSSAKLLSCFNEIQQYLGYSNIADAYYDSHSDS